MTAISGLAEGTLVLVGGVPDLLRTAPADLVAAGDAREPSTRDVAIRRAERIRAGVASYAQMRQDIANAAAEQDWRALEYDSWPAYVLGEFGDELRALAQAPGERRQIVSDLRGQGMSTRQIADVTGASKSQVDRDVHAAGTKPGAVQGADGKTYPASKPVKDITPPAPTPTPGAPTVAGEVAPAAGSAVAAASPAAPDGPAGRPGRASADTSRVETNGPNLQTPPAGPTSSLAADLIETRAWQGRFDAALASAAVLVEHYTFTADTVLAHASDAQMRELVDLHERLGQLVDAVKKARAADVLLDKVLAPDDRS